MTIAKGAATLPADVLAMFEDVPELANTAPSNREAGIGLESDPEFVGDYLKANFVEQIHQAMAARNMKKADLAKALGKSDQYVGRVLKEQGNFTLETIAEFACALGMRVAVNLFRPDQRLAVLPSLTRPAALATFDSYRKAQSNYTGEGGGDGENLAA